MIEKRSIAWLDAIINRYLSLDPEMAGKISAYEGRVIAVELQGLNKVLYMFPGDGNLNIGLEYDGDPDTVLRGSPAALFMMGVSRNVAPMMLKGEIEISGDVRLGKEFKMLLAEMDIDWEEQLAKLFGDALAFQLMSVARNISSWSKHAVRTVSDNVSEYLQEESRDVVSGAELEIYYREVDSLRNDVERLQARIEAITKGS